MRVSFDRPFAALEPLTSILSPCSKGRGERIPPSIAGRITRDGPMSNCGSHGDLAEYAAELVKIHRLGKMEIGKPVMAEVLRDAPGCLEKLSELLAQRKLETEGVLKEAGRAGEHTLKERQYTATFLRRLRTFFQL